MIPIQLTIAGLYSYQERQTIDFRNLTEAGLFGIFGSVGSGKSSILEAISYALYGETERLHGRDNRAYNMMNLKSKRAYIEFDFTNFENRIFRATREFKRNSKNFEDVKTAVVFYEFKNDSWITIEATKADEIIGLSYANFKRTIIIPQGQFKEFLELGAKDRTTMMKEIFNLQKFDLQQNTSILYNKNKSDLDQLEGQLKGFEEVNEEQISGQKEILKVNQETFTQLQSAFAKTEEKYQQQKNLKTDFETLKEKKESFKLLSAQKSKIDLLERNTTIFDQTFRLFDPLFTLKIKLKIEVENERKNKEEQSKKVNETIKKFENVLAKIKVILPQYEQLEPSKLQENDLKLIVELLNFSAEIKLLQDRSARGLLQLKEVEEKEKIFKNNIVELAKNAAHLKSQRIDATLLLNVGNWFSTNKTLKESYLKQEQKVLDYKSQIQQITLDFKSKKISEENFAEIFKEKADILDAETKTLTDQRNQLEVQKRLSHFASELHDGENCPLCGSLEHPNIIEFADVNAEITSVVEQMKKTENQKEDMRKTFSESEKLLDRKSIFEEQLKSEEKIIRDLAEQTKAHLSDFQWTEFRPDNEAEFNTIRMQSFELEKQIESLSTKNIEEQNKLETQRKTVEKFTAALQNLKLQEKEFETKIKSNLENLKLLKWDDFIEEKNSVVIRTLQQLSKQNRETEQNYQLLIQQEKELSPKLAEQKAIQNQLEKRVLEIEKEISENEGNLQSALVTQQFSNIDEVQQILKQEINIAANRNKIETFKIEFKVVQELIDNLSLKLKDFTFEEESFLQLSEQFAQEQTDLNSANDTVVKMLAEIQRLEQEFKKKEQLLKEFALLQKRAENLKIITNLFKGSGFVQYVSSIYLRQLCNHANIRFRRMTRNQLSLQLNDNNDFEIIDYLNEGRCRSVKTLSGGQAFQVSLSLALALAESVQANAKAEKNFFFIDEGFGTQDSESVNVVFETLTNLQKENRIVGIISHVEELKEKIPISLSVFKDEERGSLITFN